MTAEPSLPPAALLERCARSLPLNSPEEAQAMEKVVLKVVDNLLATPNEPKYRVLKIQNKTLRAKWFDRSGGREVATLLGFKRATSADGEAVLRVDPTEDEAQRLGEQRRWLVEQFAAVRAMAGARRASSPCCAECALQLRLPSGAVLRAAFFGSEPLSAVRDFVVQQRFGGDGEGAAAGDEAGSKAGASLARQALVLQLVHPKQTLDRPDQLAASLQSLGLVPRAVLVASVPGLAEHAASLAAQQAAEMHEAHTTHVQRERAAARGRDAAQRRKRMQDQEQRKAEKQKALDAFRADREDMQERADRRARAAAAAKTAGEGAGEGAQVGADAPPPPAGKDISEDVPGLVLPATPAPMDGLQDAPEVPAPVR